MAHFFYRLFLVFSNKDYMFYNKMCENAHLVFSAGILTHDH